ncbi:MAG: T9SS type A sorting domain-containing protein [Bacteroidetes bacterium]|nr:T9SS type A sorting domain-containing protein [Bacteroidota bacterium]
MMFGKRILISVLLLFAGALSVSAQAFLNANGPGNTFEEITDEFAPGSDTSAVEDPQCIHPAFGRHIAEVWDADQGKYVYEFYMHVAVDNDRCINFDRQRVEIKTYDPSPASLKGVTGETILYKWRFRVPVGFKPSSSFTHIHQIKAVGGNDDDPLITLTIRKGSPHKMELIHNNTTKVAIVNLSLFEGSWVECTEVIKVDSLAGTYSMVIRKVSDGSTILSYSSGSIMTIRSDNTFIRPKWGIYRSLNSPADLRDDTLRFSDFYIGESATTASPAAPSSLTATIASSTQINLLWTDNAVNEEGFAVERSLNGTTWTVIDTTEPNSSSFANTGITSTTQYYYRVRALNTFGVSAYSNTVSSIAGLIRSTQSGSWGSASTWIGGVVPTSADDVEIMSDDTVTIAAAGAVCADLTVAGRLTFANTGGLSLTVNGNASVQTGGDVNVYLTGNPTGTLTHTITLYKDLTVASGATFDMRRGSSSIVAVGTVVFTGPSNSTVSLQSTVYQSSVEEFNAVTVSKTSGAKVILQSGNLFMSNNNSTGPSILTLTSGVIETGNNVWVHLSTASGGVLNGSVSSYINGALGRGGNTSAATSRAFEVGDAEGYRPVTITTNAGIASGGYVVVRCISGNADNSSSFSGGIDRVSSLRYYSVQYKQGTGATASTGITRAALSYASGDGISHGSTMLRVASSVDGRSTWTGAGQTTTHTTSVSSTPTTITPDLFSSVITLTDGAVFHAALARASGGTDPLPVELTRFTAAWQRSSVRLQWNTATEMNNHGFEIQRAFGNTSPQDKETSVWSTIGFVVGNGGTNSAHEYSFTDRVSMGGRYSYRLKQLDRDGNFTYSSIAEVIVSVPTAYHLSQNFPNPFNPVTTIEFAVPVRSIVRLAVFNALGQEVARLVDGTVTEGIHSAEFDAAGLPSGTYFSAMRSGSFTAVQKMLLTK